MDGLLDIALLVFGLFATMSGLLYVLATIDPQTDSAESTADVATAQGRLPA